VLLVLGVAGIGVANFLELTSLLVFGPLLLTSSAFQLLTALFAEKPRERLGHMVAAGLELVLGLFVMISPLESLTGLVALVAIFLVIIGLARLGRSLVMQAHGRTWAIVAGFIALVLGVAVWFGGPAAKLGFVGLCIALDILCQGVSWSALALAERKPSP